MITAQQLEEPLNYDPSILEELKITSPTSGNQSEVVTFYKKARTALTKAFRMARDHNISQLEASKLYEATNDLFEETTLPSLHLPFMYSALGAIKGNKTLLEKIISDPENIPVFSAPSFSGGQSIGVLLWARLVEAWEKYATSNHPAKSDVHFIMRRNVQYDKDLGVYSISPKQQKIGLSNKNWEGICQTARDEIPDSKLESTLMEFLFPGKRLIEDQVRVIQSIEEKEVQASNGVSHLIRPTP